MRRLWAYIVTAFTALVLIGTSFTSIFTQTKSNIEYENGKEIVFRIGDEDDRNSDTFVDGTAVSEMAEIFEERLSLQGISRYSVVTEGIDTIKVTFAATNADEYEKVKMLLSFNGSLALTTDATEVATGDEFLTDEKAYLDDVNGYPTVVIPVDTENPQFQAVVEAVKKQQEEFDSSATGAEGEEVKTAYLYLWCDYVEDVDSFDKTQPTLPDGTENEDYDENIANKIVMQFAANELYYPDDEENKLAAGINLDMDGDGVASVTEVTKAYSNARYYVNLINAGELDYHVEYMYTKTADAWYENLIVYGMHEYTALSSTLIATLVAILVLSLLLVTFYRLGAVSGIVTTIATVFGGLSFIVLFGAEFNTAGIIGLALTAIASIVSFIIYGNKLKEECYKGRSLKKANAEAAKKSLLPIVDVNVVVIIIGAFAYLLGGVLLRAFAAATVLGGLVSLILNLTFTRGMMWLATNTTSLTGKYNVFGVETDKVPNIVNEERQTYFGPYADKDFTKKKKPIGIIAAILMVASIAGGIVFGIIDNGSVYAVSKNNVQNSQIYFETSSENSDLSINYISSMLEEIYVHEDEANKEEAVQLSTYVTSIDEYENILFEDKMEVTYYYYVVALNTPLSSEIYAYTGTNSSVIISELFETILGDVDSKATADLKEVKLVSNDQPDIAPIALATGVALLVVGVYFCLRYKLSRGLASMVIALASGIITIGIFVLTRLVVPTYISTILPVVVAISFILSIFYLNRERELIVEDRSRDNSLEHREQIMKTANSYAYAPLLISAVMAVYLGINFFGFGAIQTSFVYFVMILGTIIAALLVTTILGPLSHSIYAWLRKLSENKTPRKPRKTKKVVRNKSAEPEEAIFIGIND